MLPLRRSRRADAGCDAIDPERVLVRGDLARRDPLKIEVLR
jgi:hypothetical protein